MRRILLSIVASLGLVTGTVAAELTPLDAEGLSTVLSEHKGKVLLVNFWATWCRPCLDEIPVFMRLEKALTDQGFALIAVSLDDIETTESHVQPFMKKWFPDFSSYINVEYDMDTIVSAVDHGWNEVLPTSYLIGRDGKVARRIQGKMKEAEFIEAIEPLLDTHTLDPNHPN